MIRSSSASRSSRVVREYVSNAARAAATATSTSSGPPMAMDSIASSVAGLMTASVSLDSGATHFPSM